MLRCVGGVMRVVSVAFACVLSAALGGCAFFADPNAWPQSFKYGDSATIASGSGIRFVNERAREMSGTPPLPTMCTEPSPDVAVAFGRERRRARHFARAFVHKSDAATRRDRSGVAIFETLRPGVRVSKKRASAESGR